MTFNLYSTTKCSYKSDDLCLHGMAKLNDCSESNCPLIPSENCKECVAIDLTCTGDKLQDDCIGKVYPPSEERDIFKENEDNETSIEVVDFIDGCGIQENMDKVYNAIFGE